MYELKIYTYKIEKAVEMLILKSRTVYPLLQSNRLFLSCGMRSLHSAGLSPDGLTEHIRLLEQNIDMNTLLYKEFRNKNILPHNGVCGLYWILRKLHKEFPVNYFLFYERIMTSELWNDVLPDNEKLSKQPVGLLTGLTGVVLTCMDAEKQIRL